MRIAVPIWEDKVSPVLDTAAKLLILETLDKKKISRTEAFLNEAEIPKRCFRIQKLDIDVLICGAISRPFSEILAAAGINIIPGISGAVEEIVAAYFGGTLNQSKYSMPGCRQKQKGPMKKPQPFKKPSKRTRQKN
jgi:predicted Fe-Mo cluster-binding NifX family protein